MSRNNHSSRTTAVQWARSSSPPLPPSAKTSRCNFCVGRLNRICMNANGLQSAAAACQMADAATMFHRSVDLCVTHWVRAWRRRALTLQQRLHSKQGAPDTAAIRCTVCACMLHFDCHVAALGTQYMSNRFGLAAACMGATVSAWYAFDFVPSTSVRVTNGVRTEAGTMTGAPCQQQAFMGICQCGSPSTRIAADFILGGSHNYSVHSDVLSTYVHENQPTNQPPKQTATYVVPGFQGFK